MSVFVVVCLFVLFQTGRAYEGIPRIAVQHFDKQLPYLPAVIQAHKHYSAYANPGGWIHVKNPDRSDKQDQPDGEFKWISHVMDHWSKFHVMWPLTRKTAQQVADSLQKVFAVFGLPKIFQSGNGREFVNDILFLLPSWYVRFCVHLQIFPNTGGRGVGGEA